MHSLNFDYVATMATGFVTTATMALIVLPATPAVLDILDGDNQADDRGNRALRPPRANS